MIAKLISRGHGEFTFAEEATIGRSADNSICVESSVVSTHHARIAFDAESSRYMIEDLESLNGTRLDGAAVERPEPLVGLHLICFGGSEDFIFQVISTEDGDELDTIEIPPVSKTQVGEEVPVLPEVLREGDAPEATPKKRRGRKAAAKSARAAAKPIDEPVDEPAAEPAGGGTRIEQDVVPIPAVLAAASSAASAADAAAESQQGSEGSGWSLEIQLEGGPRRFALAEGENLVGRSNVARIRLDVADLSRRHAVILVDKGKVFVRDEGSRNHTFLDGIQVEERTPVPAGGRIVFGRLEAQLIQDGDNG